VYNAKGYTKDTKLYNQNNADNSFNIRFFHTAMERTLGQQITILREEKGLTQDELAVAAGVSRSRISNLENDQVEAPRRNTLVKLATALGVEVSVFQMDAVPRPRLSSIEAFSDTEQGNGDAAHYAVLKNENAYLKAENARLWEMLGKSSSSLGAALAGLFGAGQQVSTVMAA
jgi:transcriptional regulator with XRE-family HTH domain